MNFRTMTAAEYSDAELVSRTLAGDRDAFNRIVSRYQILICSLAYSRIGQLGQSEDVAQETFITAWKNLRFLREPDKLRAWLCGIVRNRIQKSLEREGREPAHDAAPLEAIPDSPAREALPSEQAISREEEAILWRSLEKIPELYREPFILFIANTNPSSPWRRNWSCPRTPSSNGSRAAANCCRRKFKLSWKPHCAGLRRGRPFPERCSRHCRQVRRQR